MDPGEGLDEGNGGIRCFRGVNAAPLLVWASGKDRSDPERELHTGFSIAAAGEEVLLTDPGGQRVDELEPTVVPREDNPNAGNDYNGTLFRDAVQQEMDRDLPVDNQATRRILHFIAGKLDTESIKGGDFY